MIETAIQEKTYTLEEYLDLEKTAENKHEFQNGKRITMAGGTLNHNTIAASIIRVIGNELVKKNKKFRVLSSDMNIWIEAYGHSVYPDAAVLCQTPEFHLDRQDIITNPTLIVEVSSPSTEGYDRGEKFDKYRSLSSFKEYLLVKQDKASVQVFYREKENLWEISDPIRDLDKSVFLRSIDCEISLADIYHLIEKL